MKNFTKLLLILAIASTQDKAFASFAKGYGDLKNAQRAYSASPSAATAKIVVEYYDQASPADKAKFDKDLAARGGSIETYRARAGLATTATPAASAAAAASSPMAASARSAAGSKYAASATGTAREQKHLAEYAASGGTSELPVLADAKERREQELAREKRIEQLISDKRLVNITVKYKKLLDLQNKIAAGQPLTEDEQAYYHKLNQSFLNDMQARALSLSKKQRTEQEDFEYYVLSIRGFGNPTDDEFTKIIEDRYEFLTKKQNLSPVEQQEYIDIERRLYPE